MSVSSIPKVRIRYIYSPDFQHASILLHDPEDIYLHFAKVLQVNPNLSLITSTSHQALSSEKMYGKMTTQAFQNTPTLATDLYGNKSRLPLMV